LYTGNGSTNSITGVGFQPDLVWAKGRSVAYSHGLYDAIRGATKKLSSNLTVAEVTATTGLTSLDSDGFTMGSDAGTNESAATYASWNWKANGSGVSNTDGSITSTVSANTTAGFSICTYTEPSGSFSFGHGLGVTPDMFIFKNRANAYNWIVWHKYYGSPTNNGLYLNSTSSTIASGSNWLTGINSSTISITSGQVSSTGTTVCYAFSEVEGFSSFGSYTGNGSTDGPFVYTGFRPAWIMVKRTNAADNWWIQDNARDPYNVAKHYLSANTNNAEFSNLDVYDYTANGFKIRTTTTAVNASGSTYIYAAFAENPFKNSLAR